MKPKYQLNMLAKGDSFIGEIIGILYRKDSIAYEISLTEKDPEFYDESKIMQAYHPIAAKKTRMRRKAKVTEVIRDMNHES